MANVWQKKQLDIDILELLFDYYSLRGKTIADLMPHEKRQKIYDRLYALAGNNKKGLGLIGVEKFTGMNLYHDQVSNRTRGLRLGSMYYLTPGGAEAYYENKFNKPLPGDMYFKKPTPEALYACYQNSLLLENIDISFGSRRQFKEDNKMFRNYIVDIVHGDWQIIHARGMSEGYKTILSQQSVQARNSNINHRLILCRNNRHMLQLMKHHIESTSPQTYFIVNTEYEEIKTFLTTDPEEAMLRTISKYSRVNQPITPVGYKYIIDNVPSNIYPLTGNPVRTIRRLQSMRSPSIQGIIGFTSSEQEEFYNAHFAKNIEGYSVVQIDMTQPPEDREPVEIKYEDRYKEWVVADI
ncbi:MAG: hypothetical protein GX154_08130 [Clostridiales bacterium]|nr:hypothetical protein [Clostridiales bacterium]